MPSVVNFANAATTTQQGSTLNVGLTLDQASTDTVSLEVISAAFADGDSAADGIDYTTVDQTVSFSPGATSASVAVTILTNTAATGDLTFHLYLLGPVDHGTTGSTDSTCITIHDATPAPTLANPGLQSVNENDAFSLQIDATAPPGGGALTYSATGLPAGLSVNTSTGLISGTIGYGAGETSAGNYNVTIGAVDAAGAGSSDSFLILIGDTNRPPTLTSPGNQSSAEGDSISLQVVASDPDGTALSYSASGLPAGLSINADTGLITGVVHYDDATAFFGPTSYSVTVSASDGQASASQTITWGVSDTNRLQAPGNQTNAEDDTVSLQLHATDATGEPLSYSAANLPAGLTVNPVTGLISGTIMYHTAGSLMSEVAVTNSAGTDSRYFFWTVTSSGAMPMMPPVNHAPAVSNPGEQDNGRGDNISLHVAGSDPDSDTITYGATGLPAGLSIDSSSGIISGTVSSSANDTSPYSVTLTVTDPGGLSDSQTFNWLIHQVTITVPDDQTFYVGDDVSLSVSGLDSQGATVRFAASGLPDGLGINAVTGGISGTLTEPTTYNPSRLFRF